MTHLPSELLDLFEIPERAPELKIRWFHLAGAINEIAKGREGEAVFEALKREWIAVHVLADDPHSSEHWGTYFGPMSVMPDSQGKWVESPCFESVDEAALDYWLMRASEARHPELRARYADMVWDLGYKVPGFKRPIEALRIAVDDYSRAVATVTEADIQDQLNWASRAIDLATMVHDKSRTELVTVCILALAVRTDHSRAWRFAAAALLGREGVNPSDEQREQVVTAMMRHANVELAPERVLPFQGGEVTLDLAEHYWVTDEREAAQSLARRYAAVCMPTCEDVTAMVGCEWLTRLENLLTRYELVDEARSAAVLLEKRSEGIRDSLASIEHSQEIDMVPINEHIDKMLDRTMPDAMSVYWLQFVPRLEAVEKLARVSNSGLVASFFGRTEVDSSGRVIRVLPSYRDDPESYTELAYVENLGYAGFFLRHAIGRFRARFAPDVDALYAALEQSPLLGDNNRVVVRRGLKAYLEDDHVCAAHVLVPAIEAALRSLLSGLGQPTWKAPRRGNSQERHVLLLHEVLAQPAIKEYFGRDATKYLQMLLSDPKGWNVRNNVSHGLMAGFGPTLSDRLFHVLLGLGCARSTVSEESDGHDGGAQPGV